MTTTARAPVGDVLGLVREPIDVEPTTMYRPIGIRSFGKGIFHYDPVEGSELSKLRWFKVRPDELVISNIKGWEGAIAVSSEKELDCIASNRFLTYRSRGDRADVRYLHYYFLSEPGLRLVRRASPGSTDRNLTLGIQAFESLEVPLPPIDVQHEIAHRLNLIREATLRLQGLQSKTEFVAGALPSSLAQRPDLSDQDKQTLGWKHLPLRDVMHPVADEHTVQPGQTYPNVGILSFGRGIFEKPPIDASRTSARTLNRIHAGQFIYSRLFAFEGAYAAVPKQFDCYHVSNEFPTFELDAALDADFLAAHFRSPAIWEEIGRFARRLGVRRQRVHIDTLLDFEIWLPPISVQRLMRQQLQQLQQRQAVHARATRLISALMSAAINEAFANLT